MLSEKLSSKPTDIFTATVKGRKTGAKTPTFKRTLYIAITREIVHDLRVQEGETWTLGILKRVPPIPENFRDLKDLEMSAE